jgi:hypothetical protein
MFFRLNPLDRWDLSRNSEDGWEPLRETDPVMLPFVGERMNVACLGGFKDIIFGLSIFF